MVDKGELRIAARKFSYFKRLLNFFFPVIKFIASYIFAWRYGRGGGLSTRWIV